MTNLDLDKRAKLINDQLLLIRVSTRALEYMNLKSSLSKAIICTTMPAIALGPHDHWTGPEMAHYCFDFAQQVCR